MPEVVHQRERHDPAEENRRGKQHSSLWLENPSGLFADWNPKVVCSGATDA